MLSTMNPLLQSMDHHKLATSVSNQDENDKSRRIGRSCGVLSAMDPEDERVTLKVDVSHAEHSHLIGKGGYCVKAMMLDTRCHIHFPDSNRSPNVFEKSNQVSISGRCTDVERARKRIRQMLPLLYIFTIQNTSTQVLTLYRSSYIVQHLEAKLSVEISYRHMYAFPLGDLIFRNMSPLSIANTIVVSVRGLAAYSQSVMEAATCLLDHHFGRLADRTNVWMTLEVEPKHQVAILNHMAPRGLAEVLLETTGARVRFPQVGESTFGGFSFSSRTPSPPRSRGGFYAPRLCPQTEVASLPTQYQRPEVRTMVTICGSVNGCFLARQTIMTLLPVTLISEVSIEECMLLAQLDSSALKNSLDVSISFRPKQRQSLRQSLVLKTTEANVNSLYVVLRHLRSITHSRSRRVDAGLIKLPLPPLIENNTPPPVAPLPAAIVSHHCDDLKTFSIDPWSIAHATGHQPHANRPRYPILGRQVNNAHTGYAAQSVEYGSTPSLPALFTSADAENYDCIDQKSPPTKLFADNNDLDTNADLVDFFDRFLISTRQSEATNSITPHSIPSSLTKQEFSPQFDNFPAFDSTNDQNTPPKVLTQRQLDWMSPLNERTAPPRFSVECSTASSSSIPPLTPVSSLASSARLWGDRWLPSERLTHTSASPGDNN